MCLSCPFQNYILLVIPTATASLLGGGGLEVRQAEDNKFTFTLTKTGATEIGPLSYMLVGRDTVTKVISKYGILVQAEDEITIPESTKQIFILIASDCIPSLPDDQISNSISGADSLAFTAGHAADVTTERLGSESGAPTMGGQQLIGTA